ncbi:hypothetical protein CDV36_014592 [Fusarium kuroshium]|uniref:2EXR domain-containing protein n=1 Tax=Fusarium kuroshium TaxID=2010991 RepID=A0A3M2RHE1_9HYPO|nr:hypothetical protein CDV36_014592 [Fusarium kuroshium]
MNDTFHRFLYLPWELRNEIWEFVVRPSLPGVHIFQLYDPTHDIVIGKNIEVSFPNGSPDNHHLAVPRSKTSFTGVTQNGDNLSPYLIDRGLWSACKESRLVMERHFSRLKWQNLMDKDWGSFWSMPLEEKIDMPLTGHFIDLDGHTNFFTVFPHRDLFMLRPLDLDTIDWFKLTTIHPLASAINGFDTLKNIALEYDPEWGLDMVNKVTSILSQTALTNIWIVDYSIRRKYAVDVGKLTTRNGKDVAFYLEDRRLVEVEPWMIRSEWKTIENDAQCSERMIFKDSIDFMEHVWNQVADDEDLDWHSWIQAPMRMGLLGCDCL